MRSTLLALLLLLPQLARASGIEDGEYEILFPISDDNILSQVVTVTNCTVVIPSSDPTLGAMRFDIHVTKKGSFNRSDSYHQFVPGVVYEGQIHFVIPSERVTDVFAFWFEAPSNPESDVFEGTADVPAPNGGRMKKKFWMKRIPSNNALQAIGAKARLQPER